MTTAADVIGLLRPQLNDSVTPYRHSDAALLHWLSDGQRLIAQLKPESNPVTELFTVDPTTPRQRLSQDIAYALVRVERNIGGEEILGAGPSPVTHVPMTSYGWTFYHFDTGIDYSAVFPGTDVSGYVLDPAWTSAENPILVCAFALTYDRNHFVGIGVHTDDLEITSITYGGKEMTIVHSTLSYQYQDGTTYTFFHKIGLAVLALDPLDPPANSDYVINGTVGGSVTDDDFLSWRMSHGVFKHVDVAATIAGLNTYPTKYANPDQTTHYTGSVGYNSVNIGNVSVNEGDLLITLVEGAMNYDAFTPEPKRAENVWQRDWWTPPTTDAHYEDFYSTMLDDEQHALTNDGGMTYYYIGSRAYLRRMATTGTFTDTWHFFHVTVDDFPIDEQELIHEDYIGYMPFGAMARPYVIRAFAGATVELIDGAVVRQADRDVFDSFDPGWTTRVPPVTPEAGRYFKMYARDPDDPLSFWLYPAPSGAYDNVLVTYVGVPDELQFTTDVLTLSDMYVDPLINYCVFRAASSQTEGYSAKAAAAAIGRFGQQLNLSRDTILALTGTPHRAVEQQQ